MTLNNDVERYHKKILLYEQRVSVYDVEKVIDKIAESIGNPSMFGIGSFKAIVDAEMDLVALVPPKLADEFARFLNHVEDYRDD